jgi:single-stranded DNA-binding protein
MVKIRIVGADPEQRQAKGNGLKHRVVVFRPLLAERAVATIKKGAHVLVEGSLVSSTYEQANGKGKKSKTTKITSWSIRADVVRRLDRNEQELPVDKSLYVRANQTDASRLRAPPPLTMRRESKQLRRKRGLPP